MYVDQHQSSRPPLSDWQREALEKYDRTDGNFLLVACPAAGKTRFAAAVMRRDLGLEFSQIVVVVHRTNLRRQWVSAAAQFGVHLDPDFSNGKCVISDYRGVVVTYAAVASEPEFYHDLCNKAPTLVVLDEVHHLGDEKSWGDSAEEAFKGIASKVLMLSGTPSRTDCAPIPFVRYDEDRRFHADYSYTYGDALRDHRIDDDERKYPVVRTITFQAMNGTSKWLTARAMVELDLADADEVQIGNALQSATKPDGPWIPSVIAEADRALTECRRKTPDAGGLIVAPNREAAQAYADMVTGITGEKTYLAISDMPERPAGTETAEQLRDDPTAEIEQFRDSPSARWIVAVDMISEGVDIPRLTTVVYASTKRTDMFFRQVVGRVLRCRGVGDAKNAVMFLPSVPRLLDIAADIESTSNQVLREQQQARTEVTGIRDELSDDGRAAPSTTILDPSESWLHGTGRGREWYGPEYMARVDEMRAKLDLKDVDRFDLASALNEWAGGVTMTTSTSTSTSVATTFKPAVEVDLPLHVQRAQLRDRLKTLVGLVARNNYPPDWRGKPDYMQVNWDLKRLGFPAREKCTIGQMTAQIPILQECLDTKRKVR